MMEYDSLQVNSQLESNDTVSGGLRGMGEQVFLTQPLLLHQVG